MVDIIKINLLSWVYPFPDAESSRKTSVDIRRQISSVINQEHCPDSIARLYINTMENCLIANGIRE